MLLGMLYHRKDPSQVTKAVAMAAVAKAEGVDFFYFTPGRIDLEERLIYGLVYDNGRWVEEKFRYPDIVHNTGKFTTEKVLKVIEQLNRKVPFTSQSVGNKWVLHKRLAANGLFAPFLLPTEEIQTTEAVFHYAEQYHSIIIKPVRANQGRGVMLIKPEGRQWVVLEKGGTQTFDSLKALADAIQERILSVPHLIQPYKSRCTASGLPYDFRLHAQKGGDGKWRSVSLYPRVAPEGMVITNFGYTTYLTPFLAQEFGSEYYNMRKYMTQFGLQLARHMDEIYGAPFDELGIDFTVDELGKIWLLEANWRPGPPPSFDLELDVVRNTVRYAKYLYRQTSRG